METFSALLALCAGNSSVTGEFPSKASDAELRCFFDAGDLRLNRAHYDVIVIFKLCGGDSLKQIIYHSLFQFSMSFQIHHNMIFTHIHPQFLSSYILV